jgi:SAM-dependent methyltransferase
MMFAPVEDLETVPCGICGSSQYRILFYARDYLYGNHGEWAVSECLRCNVVFLNPRIPPARIGDYYPKNYYTTGEVKAYPSIAWRRAVKAVLLEKRYGYPVKPSSCFYHRVIAMVLLPYLSRWSGMAKMLYWREKGRVLDVGCGNGEILNQYRDLGWETYGVEMSAASARIAESVGHRLFVGELMDARYQENYFDAVTLWDSLEHIHNPLTITKEIYRILKPDGRIYISVPNYGSCYARWFKDKWFMFTAPLHYYHYNRRTLTKLLEESSFKGITVKCPFGDAGLYPSLRCVLQRYAVLDRALALSVVARVTNILENIVPGGHILSLGCKS